MSYVVSRHSPITFGTYNMKKKWKITLIIAALAVILVAFILSNPLRRSEETIRSRLLQDMPLGSHLEDVRGYVQSKGWEISYVNENRGFLDQRIKPNAVVGEKSIRASLGDYIDIPFLANVTVFWGFDKDSRLIDIWVWKTWDGP